METAAATTRHAMTETLKARARAQETETLIEAITAIGVITSETPIEAKIAGHPLPDGFKVTPPQWD